MLGVDGKFMSSVSDLTLREFVASFLPVTISSSRVRNPFVTPIEFKMVETVKTVLRRRILTQWIWWIADWQICVARVWGVLMLILFTPKLILTRRDLAVRLSSAMKHI